MNDSNDASTPGSPDAEDLAVDDDVAGNRFVIRLDDQIAELTYRLEEGRMTLQHTGVPDHLEGRGIGGRLVRAAVERAERDDLTIVPWCPFAKSWIEQHPDVTDGVPIDLSPPPGR